jgi:hypothetical protein
MGKGPRAVARCGTRALVVATVAVGGLAVVATPAYAAPPTITSVFVAGSTTNKVVTSGTTIVITGTGFTGMVDNNSTAGTNLTGMHTCSNTAPAAWPTSPSGCSQVRFLGVSSSSTAGFTLATRYTVVSDTTIYATVPTITPVDGTTAGSPAAGTGSVRVQVVNSMAGSAMSGLSASGASELFYRAPLTAVVSGTINANPNGGGTIPVQITAGIAPMATLALFTAEKISAYVTSLAAGSPAVAPAAVTWKDADEVYVQLPPGQPAGNFISVGLVHDGIAGGVADSDSIKYPAVITNIQSCTTPSAVDTFVTTPSTSFPTCTGSANAPTTGDAGFKVTGKGLTGATAWSFDGTGGNVDEDCEVISDTTAYCYIDITGADGMGGNFNPPPSGVAPVTFTTATGPNGSTQSTLVPTAGSIVLYGTLV